MSTLRIIGRPRHYRPGADTNHFERLCDECDAHYLASMSLGRVEERYRTGRVSQVQFEAYMYVWAMLSPSGSRAGWREEPQDPAVRAFADLLLKVHADRLSTAGEIGTLDRGAEVDAA